MRRVERFQTRDGVLHADEAAAMRHAENLYGSKLSELAHAMVRLEKYSAMMQFLDANQDRFAELAALKADIAPEEDRDA